MTRPTKRYNLSATMSEALLKHPAIVIELNDGEEVTLEPPQLWPDAVQEFAAEGKMTDASKLLLGDQYERFVHHGGTNALLNLVIAEHTKASAGE